MSAKHVLTPPAPPNVPRTDTFGPRKPIQTAEGLSPDFHSGWDYRLGSPGRTFPVIAAGPGRVLWVSRTKFGGLEVAIEHDAELARKAGLSRLITRYAHLTSAHVAVGQRVGRRESLGVSGRTGRTSGIHLHWEVLDAGLNPLDPAIYTDPEEDDMPTITDKQARALDWLDSRRGSFDKRLSMIDQLWARRDVIDALGELIDDKDDDTTAEAIAAEVVERLGTEHARAIATELSRLIGAAASS